MGVPLGRMVFVFPAVADFGLDRAAEVLTRAFADYFVNIPFSAASLMQAARADGVDLTASRMIVGDGVAVGAALVARRGWTSRLAGMGVVPEARRQDHFQAGGSVDRPAGRQSHEAERTGGAT